MYVVLVKPNPYSGPVGPDEHESPEEPGDQTLPTAFVVHQNYPNPFNPETEIRFEIPESRRVIITIYNLLGQKVRELMDQDLLPGSYRVVWDARDDLGRPVPGGAYFYRVEAVRLLQNGDLEVPVESFAAVRKMVFLR